VRQDSRADDAIPAQVCRQAGLSWTARVRGWMPGTKQVASGGPDPKTATAVDPCGRYFASTSKVSMGRDPQTVSVYSNATHQEVARIAHSANVNSVAFSADGRYVLTGGEDHAIKIWDLQEQRQAAEKSACQLRQHIARGCFGVHFIHHPESKRDGGIDMRSADFADNG